MTRCTHCGGVMQLVPLAHVNEKPELTDDRGRGWNRSCLLCGRSNTPLPRIEDVPRRRRQLNLEYSRSATMRTAPPGDE